MKRNVIALVLVFLAVTVPVMAQTGLVAPRFGKVLRVKSKGVNIRQEPSTQSKRIGNGPEYLLVIDETDDWYHACVLQSGGVLSQPGYVSKKVCKVQEAPALDAAYVKNAWENAQVNLVTRQTGRYKGYSIITYYEFYCGNETYNVFIGKMVGNACIGRNYFYQFPDDEEYTLQCEAGGSYTIPASRVGKQDLVNWGKLTDADLDKLASLTDDIGILLAGTQEQVYSMSVEENEQESGEGVVCYRFEPENYQGECIQVK